MIWQICHFFHPPSRYEKELLEFSVSVYFDLNISSLKVIYINKNMYLGYMCGF